MRQSFSLQNNPSAVDNFLWMVYSTVTVHSIVVKFGVPKNQVYWYDYHIKNLILFMIASPLCKKRGKTYLSV